MARQLWLLRHGEAEPHVARPDPERRLTPRGERQSRAAGAALARLGIVPAALSSSPPVPALATSRPAPAIPPCGALLARAAAPGLRQANRLPDRGRPAGEATAALPVDHIVIVMMENHSFDNSLGMRARRGQPLADGFSFDAAGVPLNSN